MTTSEQWNYGDGHREIITSIKEGIISYEQAACYSFDYAFANHSQAIILCNNLLTKTIDFFLELATVVDNLYHRIFLKYFGP